MTLADLLSIAPADRDAWLDARLGIEPPPPDEALPAGAVPYLPCGVAEILAAVRDAPITAADTFVDIGAGLGRVAIAVHLLTGARAIGVELQPGLVARARVLAGDRAEFVEGNAADVLPAATIYFLYAPCNGALLARVLARLATMPRPFVVCAVDVPALDDVAWLARRAPTIYDAR